MSINDAHMPIKALNQFSSDFVIKARVMKKGDLRNWSNARGQGQILNLDLIDREQTVIQATAFNDQALRINEVLEQGKVYTFGGGTVKLANKRYTSIPNDYCLTFDQGTQIQPCGEDK